MIMHAFAPSQRGKRSSRGWSAAAFAWSEAQADARGRSASWEPLTLLAGAAGAADAVIIFVLSLFAFVLRNGFELPVYIVTTASLASLLMANALSLSGVYTTHIKDGFMPQVGRAVKAWSIVFVLLLAIGYLTKTSSDYSRLWAVCWYVTVVLGLALVRLGVSVQIRRWRSRGRLATMVAIVDLAGAGDAMVRRLAADGSSDARLIGVFGADGAGPSDVNDLVDLSRLFRIDEIFVLVSGSAPPAVGGQLASILRRLGTIPTNVRICPIIPELEKTPVRHTSIVHNMPMLTVHNRPLGAWSSLVKRSEDLVIGGVLLVVLLPLLAIIAIAIKIDSPGPVLFRQARQGFNHNIFTVLKFRSMTHQPTEDHAVVQAKRGDQRVTRLGAILRRTSLDELPQLFNVLRGEMSLVGPRPHAVIHNEQYSAAIDDYLGRHRVQPGITGWAQINGLRGETDTLDKMQKRVEHDLAYIDSWSIGLDLRIIVLTAINVLFHREEVY